MTNGPAANPVAHAIEQANQLLDSSPDHAGVAELIERLEALSPRDLARFDWQARSLYSGVTWDAFGKLRWPVLRGAREELWETLALVAPDGHVRERAARSVPASPLGARLLVLRCLDWVRQVRDAALARLDGMPHDLLVEALPLAEQLAAERHRGKLLDALLDARLADNDLRLAARTGDVLVRRAAWRRLAVRGAARVHELADVAARDSDVLVRAVAAKALPNLPIDQRRRLAEALVADRVGWVAAPALAALVELDGTAAILDALVARTAPVRRAAQGWAAIHDIDARAVYSDRLAGDPNDALGLQALADLANPEDFDTFRRMLTNPRSRIRAAGLRALSRLDSAEGRTAALNALREGSTGRVTWAAADVLRDGAPNGAEAAALAEMALHPQRTDGQRFRILSILRPAPWLHLDTLLNLLQQTSNYDVRWRLTTEFDAWIRLSRRIARGPDPALRSSLESRLDVLDERQREAVLFVLRTSS